MTTKQLKNLAPDWIIDCKTQKERDDREAVVKNSIRFSEILLQILAKRHDAIERKGLREEDYKEAGWMTLQAFRNGKLAALEEIADLFVHLERKP